MFEHNMNLKFCCLSYDLFLSKQLNSLLSPHWPLSQHRTAGEAPAEEAQLDSAGMKQKTFRAAPLKLQPKQKKTNPVVFMLQLCA